ncbi:MAG TPA: hypothetical protein VGG30_07655, partial [Pirellulales bacterium]
MALEQNGNNAPADPIGNSAGASRWSDPKVAAQLLLSHWTDSRTLIAEAPCEIGQPIMTAGHALESAAGTARPIVVTRWDDLQAAAQALLAPNRWPGLFVADPL